MDGERELGELRAQITALRAAFEDFRQEVRSSCMLVHEKLFLRLDQHSNRLRSLEGWRFLLLGAFAMLGIVWSIVHFVMGR